MWTRRRFHGAVLFLWGLPCVMGMATAADQPAAEKAALDKLLLDALKDMHNRAADIYNGGDANGAYRMFQGGLLMAKPLLAHHPEAQQVIDQGMQNAERQASIPQRAKVLHETIETVRTHLKPPAAPQTTDPSKSDKSARLQTSPPLLPPSLPIVPPGMGSPPPSSSAITPAGVSPAAATAPKKSLWDRLGGEANVAKVVDLLITLTLDDPTVNFSRGNRFTFDKPKEDELKQRLIAFISAQSNGTVVYTGKSMAEAHQAMGIRGDEFDAFVKTLELALKTNGVKTQEIEELLEKMKATRKDIVTAPDK